MQIKSYAILTVLVFLVIVVSLFVRDRLPYPITNRDARGSAIVCFGDSITRGSNVQPDQTYPQQLAQRVGRPVINVGINGITTAGSLGYLESALSHDPYMVIVILGGNDALRGVPQEETFKNLEAVIRRIHERGAMVALGQLGPLNMYSYRSAYRDLARQTGCILIPHLLRGIFAHPEHMYDHIHPNEKGYALMAGKVYNAIKPFVNGEE